MWLLMAHGPQFDHRQESSRFAGLARNKDGQKKKWQCPIWPVHYGAVQGQVIGLDKSSNLNSFLWKEALSEKIFVAWSVQSTKFFFLMSIRTQVNKRYLICFLLVHLVSTQACRFALWAHNVKWMEKESQSGGGVKELNTLLNPIWWHLVPFQYFE